MISSDLERNMAVSHLCKEILNSHESICFVAALNKKGKAIEFEIRNDRIITKMNKQESEMLFMQRTLQTTLGMGLDDSFGPLNSIILQRETLYEILFPYSEGIFFIMCNLDVIPRFLSKKISFLLRDFEWNKKTSIC